VKLVGGVGVPHTPQFPTMVDERAPLGPELERLYGEAARHLRALEPDVLIFFTADHYNNFFVSSVPIFSVGVAESASGPNDYPNLKRYEVSIDASLGHLIQDHAVRAGFDVGMSQEFELDHPITIPLHFLTPLMDVPIVPVFIDALLRPIPSSARCRALGANIGETLERSGDARRVAAIASGSFSLEIGGPRISETSHVGVPDPDWVERILFHMRAGDIDGLVREATDERLEQAGNAGGELLEWIAMLGMIDPGPPVFLEAQSGFGHAWGAWLCDGERPGR
jgi:aromatic ring-opening dioxygenase catalytic subunit (LigB family)